MMSDKLPCAIYIDASKNKVFFNLANGEKIEVPQNFQDILTELALAREFIAAFGPRERGDILDWSAILKASDRYDNFKKSLGNGNE